MNKFVIVWMLLIIIFIYIIVKKKEKYEFIIEKDIEYSDNLTKKDITNLKKGQKIMTDMFKEFDSICRKNNIKYWCRGGTFIGAMRHKGWVPWDGDIDVGVMDYDIKKLKKIFIEKEQVLKKRGIFYSHPKDKPCIKLRSNKAYYIYTPWGNNWDKDKGIQIDIMIFKDIEDNKIFSPYGSTICGPPDKLKRLKSDIFPLKEIQFEGFNVYVPNKYKKLSKEIWKSYPPELPNLKKRYPHEGRIKISKHYNVI